MAAAMCARWANACREFPGNWPVRVSNSCAKRSRTLSLDCALGALAPIFEPSLMGEALGQPDQAGQEGFLFALQPVLRLVEPVAQDQPTWRTIEVGDDVVLLLQRERCVA